MKITLSQILLTVLFTGAVLAHETEAQDILNKHITIKVEDQNLKAVLGQLENIAQTRFVYSDRGIRALRRVSFSAKDEKIIRCAQ